MQGKGIATLSIGYNTLLIFTPEHFYEEIQRELRKTYDQANKKQGAVQKAPCFRKEYLQKILCYGVTGITLDMTVPVWFFSE